MWVPQPGPQLEAFLSKADVLLYGGAAGGGKTALAVGLALTQHQRTLFVREEAVQLSPAIDEVATILGARDGLNGQEKIWRMKNGRQIQFGGIPNPGDENKYQGNPRDLLVIDEAANVRKNQALFLMGWVRSADPDQRCRTLLCSNPPTTAEGEWLIEYFAPWLDKRHANPAKPGELRWFASINGVDTEVDGPDVIEIDGEQVTPKSRTFIPSKVQDNRFYRDSGYIATLQALPEPLRSQMLHGNFLAGREDDVWQVIPTRWVEEAQARWIKQDIRPRMDAIGLDVARGGKDNTILARRHGLWADEPVVVPGIDTPDGRVVLGHVLQHQRDAAPLYVDSIGPGASVLDFAIEAGMDCRAMIGSQAPTRTDKTGTLSFANMRSQWYWNMRELLDPGSNIGVALPPSDELKRDLCAPTFTHRSGKIVVEPKEHLVKRIGRSPDFGDAYVMAFAETEYELTGMFAPNQARPSAHLEEKRLAKIGWNDPIPYR